MNAPQAREPRWLARARLTAALALTGLMFAFSGCGGGGSDDGSDSGSSGDVAIALSDAEGDFLSYSVDVVSLELTKANGAAVETLPNKTRVDFAQLIELTEFVTAATIPSGVYTAAKIRLDYSNADIQVEDAAGDAVAALARDSAGNPLARVELEVKLDDRKQLVIAPGIPAHLTLDFNLEASNSVNTAVSPPIVAVRPVLIADVMPEDAKPHRVRGPLASVDTGNASYRVGIRPFHAMRGEHGRLTVHTDADTVFEIDGVTHVGGAGMARLATLPTFAATLAIGSLDATRDRFVAQEVYARSSVAFGTSDVVWGSVVARSGNTLTVLGGSLLRADGTFTFRDTLSVAIGPDTKVTRQGQALTGNAASIADISVGSRIAAFGTLSASTLDASGGDDLVRLEYSTLTGSVNAIAAGGLTLALQNINRRRVTHFNFAGTGTSGANDALAASYRVNTGGLSLTGIGVSTPVRVRGFVQPFGQAPEDFDAQTVVNVVDVEANLVVDWTSPAATAFSSVSSTGLDVDLAGAPNLHHVWRADVASDLTAAPYSATAPSVAPRADGKGVFAIAQAANVKVYTTFEGYAAALQAELAAGKAAALLSAQGAFDDASVSLTARSVTAVLR